MYSFEVTSTCGEQAFIGSFQISVRDDEVIEAVGLDQSGRRTLEATGRDIPTLRDLLKQGLQASSDGAEVVNIEYDDVDGHPRFIEFDYDVEAIDDESCFRITNYVEGKNAELENAFVLAAKDVSDACSVRHSDDRVELSTHLPLAVRSSIKDIVRAAWNCDFRKLERLGLRGRPGFFGAIGFTTGLSQVWRNLDSCDGHALFLAGIFDRDFEIVDGQEHEVFPDADGSHPVGIPGDIYVWAAERLSGRHSGFEIGIHSDGDWLYLAPTSFRYEGCRPGKR